MRGVTPGGRRLNYKRSLRRNNRFPFFKPEKRIAIPSQFSLDVSGIGIFNQLQEGSCTANAWSNLYDYRQIMAPKGSPLYFHNQFMKASRNFFYWHERFIDGDVGEDNGSYLHTGAQVISTVGTISEAAYPYDQATLFQTPSAEDNKWALEHRIMDPKQVDLSTESLVQCLLAGNPIVFGMPVWEDFEDLNSQDYILSGDSEDDEPLGGHANMLYGFEIVGGKTYFWDMNSWGTDWGKAGVCLICEDYVNAYFSDLWTA